MATAAASKPTVPAEWFTRPNPTLDAACGPVTCTQAWLDRYNARKRAAEPPAAPPIAPIRPDPSTARERLEAAHAANLAKRQAERQAKQQTGIAVIGNGLYARTRRRK